MEGAFSHEWEVFYGRSSGDCHSGGAVCLLLYRSGDSGKSALFGKSFTARRLLNLFLKTDSQSRVLMIHGSGSHFPFITLLLQQFCHHSTEWISEAVSVGKGCACGSFGGSLLLSFWEGASIWIHSHVVRSLQSPNAYNVSRWLIQYSLICWIRVLQTELNTRHLSKKNVGCLRL